MKQQSPLADIRRALAAGDMPAVRSALLALSDEGRDALETRLGAAAFARLMLHARTARRANRGRVVVIHGIMGGELATRDASGDEDLVWVHYPRLVLGRIEDFKLDAAGNNAAALDVLPCGLVEEYLPLLFELNGTWDVLPFAFDWRLDMTRSADLLDEAITGWAKGEPVHIVAHSMGGLVARRFMQRHPATWQAMADPGELRRGGRLVMMGTPNRGSFAIPFVLTGEEQTVRLLALLDVKHSLRELLGIIDTFVGGYQMLPSPLHAFGDARLELYEQASWGNLPVAQARLDAGRAFQQEIDAVIDPPRMVYVAGFDQRTPYRVRIEAPGKFSYQETRRGDGRVPHELGELPGVRSFYVREAHGDLPANESVLAAIHDLLLTGTTTALAAQLPAGVRGKEARTWRKASEIAPLPPEVRALLPLVRAKRGPARVPAAASAILEQALLAPFVGPSRQRTSPAPAARKPQPSRKKRAPIAVEVMWGDITRAAGEVFAAGHYEGVLPINGELALDRVVSGLRRGQEADAGGLVITTLARRGQVRASVGDVNFFPWAGSGRRSVAIAGMGRAGTFGKPELQRAVRSLVEQATALPAVRTINTLLIGAGTGNLPVPAALDAMLSGVLDALQAGAGDGLRKIRIVEYNWLTARVIQGALEKLHGQRPDMGGIRIRSAVVAGAGGGYSDEILMSSIVAALARRYGEGVSGRSAVTALLAGFKDRELRRRAEKVLAELRVKGDLLEAGASLDLVRRERDAGATAAMPTRISFAADKDGVRVAAIGDSAVVPERFVPLNWRLVDELVAAMTDPADASTIDANAALLASFVVPADFRAEVGHSEATIFEVDRTTARIHWEMMARLGDQTSIARPIALESIVARQLRTTYSPAPSRAPQSPGPLRALVIGDPGSGSYRLEEARREALAVAELLRHAGAEVTALIGPEAATMLAVLRQLGTPLDILHYAGHGDFDPQDPARAGWLFGDGQFFTARELGGARYMPRLVIANACLTASLGGDDAHLLAGLADEFFKRGVRNYVGTAWPVHDTGAVDFARHFYAALLDPAAGASLGEALLRARQALKAKEGAYGALWGAYQHYGDPSLRIS